MLSRKESSAGCRCWRDDGYCVDEAESVGRDGSKVAMIRSDDDDDRERARESERERERGSAKAQAGWRVTVLQQQVRHQRSLASSQPTRVEPSQMRQEPDSDCLD